MQEWYDERYGDGDDDDGGDDGKAEGGSAEEAGALIMTTEKLEAAGATSPGGSSYGAGESSGAAAGGAEAGKDTRTSSSLFVVAFLGSLDDLTLSIPMLVGQALDWIELGEPSAAAHSVPPCRCCEPGTLAGPKAGKH